MKPAPGAQHPSCGSVEGLLPALSSKWAMPVVSYLIERPRRFSELKRAIGGITQKSLTAALRDLERNGLVARTVTPTIPPRVDYALTELGHSMLQPAHALANWAMANREAILGAQERFAEANPPEPARHKFSGA